MAGLLPGLDLITEYIRRQAPLYGIDPEIALTVARREGLKPDVWQSSVVKNGRREPSYGPFQLYMGGGLGNEMLKKTGVDPSKPENWQQGVDFALASAAKGGWGPWYGARAAGITGMQGIDPSKVVYKPMALAGKQPDFPPVTPTAELPGMPPPQSPIGIGTPPIPVPFPPMGKPELPDANPPAGINPTVQQDFASQFAPPPAPPPTTEKPVMADTTSDPVSQLLAQYLAQSQGESNDGLLSSLFPNRKPLLGRNFNNALINIGAGLASGRGWGPGFAAGVQGYQNQRQNDIENQRADFATKLGVLKLLGYGSEPDGFQRAAGGGLQATPGGPHDPKVIASEAKAKVIGGGEIDDETADNVARQWLSGDDRALMYWGRGNTGAANVMKIRQRAFDIGKNEFNMSPADISAKTAEFAGMRAGHVTIAKRAAQADLAAREALKIIPTVRSASAAVPRTQITDLNQVWEAARSHTGDTKIVQLGVALNSLVNIYARAINPTGVSTESDKEHAREMLNKAWSDGQINAAVDQMEIEMQAALTSADAAKKALTKSYVGGEEPAPTAPTVPPPPPGFVVQ